MELILLHGAAITSSRAKLVEIKRRFDTNNVIVFENGSDIQSILGTITTPSLLSQEQLIVLENPPEDFALDSSLITHHSSLVFWFDHEISDKKPILPWVKKLKGEILYFPESKEISVFPFLDCLAAGDKKAFLELDKLKNAGFDIFYFITMVFYLLRSLVADPKGALDFVKRKNAKMRANFSDKELVELYKFVLEVDFKLKSGLMDAGNAQFLLVNRFVNFF